MIKLTEFQKWVQKTYNDDYDLADDLNIATIRARMMYLSKWYSDQVEDIHERQEQKLDMRELSITALTGESSQELINNALINAYQDLILEELEIIEEYEEDLELELLEAQHNGLEQAKREQAAKL